MAAWQLWLVAAVLLLIAEMFTSGFWLACVAVGAAEAQAIERSTSAIKGTGGDPDARD